MPSERDWLVGLGCTEGEWAGVPARTAGLEKWAVFSTDCGVQGPRLTNSSLEVTPCSLQFEKTTKLFLSFPSCSTFWKLWAVARAIIKLTSIVFLL